MNFFKKKSLSEIQISTKNSNLKKNLGSLDLIFLGIGAIVGGGIFVLSGLVSAEYTGPAIIISYCVTGFISLLMAFFYVELTTMVPSSAAIYSYSYNIFGEIIAWLAFWMILLEFATAASSVAVGWSNYFYDIVAEFLPYKFAVSPFEGGYFNIISSLLVSVLTLILFLGINLSKNTSNLLVIIKFATIFFFITFSAKYFDKENFKDFMPFGLKGLFAGGGLLFYSFNGYSLLSSAVEECRDPVRNLLHGLIFSVIIAIIIYVLTALFLNGAINYQELKNVSNPLVFVFQKHGRENIAYIVMLGAIFSMVTGLLVNMYAITRITYSIANDQLLPDFFTQLRGDAIPYISIIFTGIFVFCLSGLFPLRFLGHISSISSLINSIILLVLFVQFRRKHYRLTRILRVPYVKILLPITFCLISYLLVIQFIRNAQSIIYFWTILGWIILGSVLYFIRKIFIQKNQ
ncbi:MAG: amino acid permease [Rickettsia sp.]|nr:amino acid permease [Rickettsia sp.]